MMKNAMFFLGEVEYFGELGKAYREVCLNYCKFVIVTQSGNRYELATY